VIEVDKKNRVKGFQEKPQHPKTIPGDLNRILASTGIYLFDKDALLKELEIDALNASDHDFGKNVIPQMMTNKRHLYVYNFADNNGQPAYWRDIGTRDAYYQANMDLVKERPPLDLYDRKWPVRTFHEQYPPTQMISCRNDKGPVLNPAIINSLIAEGCQIRGATIIDSVLSSHIKVSKGARVERSVIMEGVIIGENVHIQNAIIDKEVVIPANSRIGFDLELEAKRFDVTNSGIVIVAKKTAMPVFSQ